MRPRRHWAATLVAGLVMAPPAHPQAPEASAQVVITGSRIKQDWTEGPAAVVELSAGDLQRLGYASLTDALRDVSQSTGGMIDVLTRGFTPAASAINLRGFGSGRSLVLLDGRRLPVFPVGDNGTDNFVDLNTIPVAAIETVEILTDGASAIYGSDAISGVVNVHLKKDLAQSVTARFSTPSGAGGSNERVQLATGYESDAAGKLLLFLDYENQDVLDFSARSYSRWDRLGGVNGPGPGVFSSFGYPGTVIGASTGESIPNPSCSTSGGGPGIVDGFCKFNRAAYRELAPEFTHGSITALYEKAITQSLTVFSHAIYFNGRTKLEFEPIPLNSFGDTGVIVAANAPNNPTNPSVDDLGAFSGLNDDIIFLRRLVEYGPRASIDRVEAGNLLLGLRAQTGRFDWEIGMEYAEQRLHSRFTGFALKDAFATLLAGPAPDANGVGAGTLNLFEPIPQSVVDATSVVPTEEGKSAITTADAQLTGNLVENWAGTVGFAAVIEHTRQSYSDVRDAQTTANNVISFGGTSGGGNRTYNAAGVEFQIPLLRNLKLNVAGRYDRYDDRSDVAGAFSPRAALQFWPIENVLLRASAGKSFRAPDLQRLFGGTTVNFADIIDTPQCIRDGGTGRGDPSVPTCIQVAQSIHTDIESNLHLREERGENYSAGVVWKPAPQLTLSLDAFYIRLRDIVNTPTAQFILDRNAEDGSFADAITRNALAGTPANPGGLQTIALAARNLSFQRTAGLDFSSQFELDSAVGRWTTEVRLTYLQSLEAREEPDAPVIDGLTSGVFGEFVRFRGVASVEWSGGRWGAAALLSYVGPYAPQIADFASRVGSWTTLNLNARYEVPWNATLQIGANNVFNREPPRALGEGDVSQPFYDSRFHNPYGTVAYLSYVQRF